MLLYTPPDSWAGMGTVMSAERPRGVESIAREAGRGGSSSLKNLSLDEFSNVAASTAGEDWSHLNDDQFMKAVSGVDDFASSSNGSTQQGRE